jgi:hypothetical protein
MESAAMHVHCEGGLPVLEERCLVAVGGDGVRWETTASSARVVFEGSVPPVDFIGGNTATPSHPATATVRTNVAPGVYLLRVWVRCDPGGIEIASRSRS